jgi:hypothetical protein
MATPKEEQYLSGLVHEVDLMCIHRLCGGGQSSSFTLTGCVVKQNTRAIKQNINRAIS